MTKHESETFRMALKNKGAEVAKALRNREGIMIEKSADELDEVERGVERDIAIHNLDRESRTLREIRDALRRIDEAGFGLCLHCGDEISPKRMDAVPWTPFCLRCQEAADRADECVLESAGPWQLNAA